MSLFFRDLPAGVARSGMRRLSWVNRFWNVLTRFGVVESGATQNRGTRSSARLTRVMSLPGARPGILKLRIGLFSRLDRELNVAFLAGRDFCLSAVDARNPTWKIQCAKLDRRSYKLDLFPPGRVEFAA